jgi:hypothetical protein
VGLAAPIEPTADSQKFFASFFQERSSFLKKETPKLLHIGIRAGLG